MKLIYLTLTLFFIAINSTAQLYSDPNFAIPASGYGADGANVVGVVSFPNPNFITEDIKIYYPSNITSKVPTLFYSHGFGGNIPSHIIGLLNFVAKKGYAIVFVPYQTTGVSIQDRYDNLLQGFRKAARDYPAIIDTTKVGFIGHSFGGGATFAIAYKSFTQTNWGQNGRFMHASAPWYSFDITQTELQSFPTDVKLLVEIYDDDTVNDHRMAADMFNSINIALSEKDFITVNTSVVNNYTYTTGHDLPTTYAAFDALDYYAYYRLIDALCDYSFTGSLGAKNVALGNGSLNQITMPNGLQNLVQTDLPQVLYPESKYGFPCSSSLNQRNMYCSSITKVDNLATTFDNLEVFPNPFNAKIQILNTDGTELFLLINKFGQIIYSGKFISETNFSQLPADIYFLKAENSKSTKVFKLIKE